MAAITYKPNTMPMDMDPTCSVLTSQPQDDTAFDMSDFLTDSTTPESASSCLAYPVNSDGCYTLDAWTVAQLKSPTSRVRVMSEDDISLDSVEGSSVGPKKARRQAQNRAAQRAFRERKELYIKELEDKAVEMRKEITDLEKDRSRLESLLKVAKAEIDTLRSLPHKLCTHAGQRDHNEIACKLDGVEGRHSIVLTLDFGVRSVSVTQQKSVDSDHGG